MQKKDDMRPIHHGRHVTGDGSWQYQAGPIPYQESGIIVSTGHKCLSSQVKTLQKIWLLKDKILFDILY
jgi:hypothetical protein